MNSKHILLLIGSVSAISFLIGLYITAIFQNQLQLLIIPTAIIAVLSWFGSGTDILKLVRDWWEERKSKPKLIVEHDEGHPAQFAPKTEIERNGLGLVKTKVLTIGVYNDSDGIAQNCTASFKIDNHNKIKFPSDERKFLRWARADTESMNIGARKEEYLNIVFSVEKTFHDMNTFVAERDSINGPNHPREKDGFELGNHTFVVIIETDSGQKTELKFRINVTDNWEELSMVLIKTKID